MNSKEMATASLADYEIALKSVVTAQSSVHMFEVGTMTLPSGDKWDITVCVMSEPIRKLIEPLIRQGIPGMTESYAKVIPGGNAYNPDAAKENGQRKGEPN